MEVVPNYLLIQYKRERERCWGGEKEREEGRGGEERGKEGRRGEGGSIATGMCSIQVLK